MDGGRRTVDDGWWTTDGGRRTVDDGTSYFSFFGHWQSHGIRVGMKGNVGAKAGGGATGGSCC